MEAPEPKWDFKQWTPDLVVICLGLNDYSGLKDKDGTVTEQNHFPVYLKEVEYRFHHRDDNLLKLFVNINLRYVSTSLP
jgi:hypothetical protein